MNYLVTVVDENDELVYDVEIEADDIDEAYEIAMREEALGTNETIYLIEEYIFNKTKG